MFGLEGSGRGEKFKRGKHPTHIKEIEKKEKVAITAPAFLCFKNAKPLNVLLFLNLCHFFRASGH